ncbi:MAG: NAD(P)-dependent oxidoreductase [Chloroflexota bacterium]|nr:NAD(P)-dependent oxidoreductase [Chloroflexota bacterium]
MRVCVTGACGWTAYALIGELCRAGQEVVVFDLPGGRCDVEAAACVVRVARGDVAVFQDVVAAVQGADAIVHLAVTVGEAAYGAPEAPFAVNVLGTYNVFEAARRGGASKIVLMSEAAVHVPPLAGERLSAVADWRSAPGGDHLYDLTKRLQEEIAKDYAETFGMAVTTLRAGHIVDGRAEVDPVGRPLSEVTYCRGGWVDRYDLAKACVRALAFGEGGYRAYHVIGSTEAHERFDVERTERELSLEFTHRFGRYHSQA